MGSTFEEAEANGTAALREWAADRLAESDHLPRVFSIVALRHDPALSDGFRTDPVVVSFPVHLDGERPARVKADMDAGLVAEIDEAARRRGLTRAAFLASAARDKIARDRRFAPA